MKRKIIKLGQSTYVASLPCKWLKQQGLVKGDYLEFEEKENSLLISTEKRLPNKEKEIDITGLDTKIIERSIISAYIKGYDEISLLFKKPETTNIKTEEIVKINELIQKVANQHLIGMEIIEQRDNFCKIKDLSGVSSSEYNNVLRRIFLLIKSLGEQRYELLQNFDPKKIDNLTSTEHTISRLTNYSKRLLNKFGYGNERFETSQEYLIVSRLKDIAKVYKFIDVELAKRKDAPKKEVMNAFAEVVKSFNLAYESYYKFDKEKLKDLIASRVKFFTIANKFQYGNKTDFNDVILISRLSVIIIYILYITEEVIFKNV